MQQLQMQQLCSSISRCSSSMQQQMQQQQHAAAAAADVDVAAAELNIMKLDPKLCNGQR
jgi:hypothetical protein